MGPRAIIFLISVMLCACAHQSGSRADSTPVTGIVIDESDHPLGQSVVTIGRIRLFGYTSRNECTAVSDLSSGEFLCADLKGQPFRQNARYRIRVQKQGFAEYDNTFTYRTDMGSLRLSLQDQYSAESHPVIMPPPAPPPAGRSPRPPVQ